MRNHPAPPDVEMAGMAARQHGVVSVTQLAQAGIDKFRVHRRIRSGRLHRIHRGVYAVGHKGLSDEGRWMAAVLACGEGAVLSHLAAAALWGLLPRPAGPIDVTVAGSGGRSHRPGIRRHRSSTLRPEQMTRSKGIPVTTPARVIADLRRVASAEQLRRAIRQAEVLGLEIGPRAGRDLTRSELEHRFLRLCRRHRLPPPEVNAQVGRFIVDFVWRGNKLIVETDGYRYHRGRQAFEDDRARDVELRRRGFGVVRFTHSQVTDDPRAVAAALRDLLRR
jgi:very-short-patch-repair endonuclease